MQQGGNHWLFSRAEVQPIPSIHFHLSDLGSMDQLLATPWTGQWSVNTLMEFCCWKTKAKIGKL